MHIVSLALSVKKGTRKTPSAELTLKPEHGVCGDAHAGPWHRQVSLLANESLLRAKSGGLDVSYGDFAENIVTEGLDLLGLEVGDRLLLGNTALIEITQFGKTCRKKCAIYYQAGDCIMPREGVFARVVRGGTIQIGDPVTVVLSLPARMTAK